MIKKHVLDDYQSTFKMALPPTFLLVSTQCIAFAYDVLPKETIAAVSFNIVSVAMFSMLILKKKLFLTQILATFFIAIGLTNFSNRNLLTAVFSISNFFGDEQELYACIAILVSILCYGLAYVLLEYNLKSSEHMSLWVRGIQMNIFVVPISMFITFGNYYLENTQRGFFDNFNIIAWFFIIFMVACNVMEIFVMKCADAMFRMIALSAAVTIIGLMRHPFSFNGEFANSPVRVGAGLVLAGTILYTLTDIAYPHTLNVLDEDENELRIDSHLQNQSFIVPMKLYQSVPTVSYSVKNNFRH
jgi:hypothetical protein